MICQNCLDAASGIAPEIPVCSVCGNGPVSVYNDARPTKEQSVVKHKKPGAKAGHWDYWCTGSKKPPRWQTAHDFCNGCPCQHRPSGAWKG